MIAAGDAGRGSSGNDDEVSDRPAHESGGAAIRLAADDASLGSPWAAARSGCRESTRACVADRPGAAAGDPDDRDRTRRHLPGARRPGAWAGNYIDGRISRIDPRTNQA